MVWYQRFCDKPRDDDGGAKCHGPAAVTSPMSSRQLQLFKERQRVVRRGRVGSFYYSHQFVEIILKWRPPRRKEEL